MSLFWEHSRKKTIQSFVNFFTMWVVKIVESFVGDVGEELIFQIIIKLSMLIFAPVMICYRTHYFDFSHQILNP